MEQGQGSNSSSDFVRKLYKMLEDPSYDSVVRWGNEGDSFVVLENEKFTKSILPKHFKHSNFASFVRQLNKYDFHKVRQNNEESGQSMYGPGAWEFKHPDFKANNKDALDNIRRKAPVPRKSTQGGAGGSVGGGPVEEVAPTQQVDMVNTQLLATQQQLQTLQERYSELTGHHAMLLQEVIGLQKTVVNHEHVIQNVMSFLHSVDAQRRRDSRVENPFRNANSGPNGTAESPTDDEPSTPLQHASKLLNELNANAVLNTKNLEHMTEISRQNGNISTPPSSEAAYKAAAQRPSSRNAPHSASSSASMRYGDLDSMVYPIGQNQGIDPMYSEHVHNIPYPLPSKPAEPTDPRYQQQPQQPPTQAAAGEPRKKHALDPGWVRQPQILLVEDDPTCRRIGGKFLYAFNCSIDSALDGLEAVNKLNAGSKYDLILMDIIMPNLDGVSACHLVRQFDSTPIIAMTSNIRSDDISMYFQHGMNDVLPKPFTKEGLLSMLEKHLGHLKKGSGYESMSAPPSAGPMTHTSSRQSLKEEESPRGSPAALSNNWNSPSHLAGMSPVTSNMSEHDYAPPAMRGAYGMDSSGMQYNNAPTATMTARSQGPAHRRQISDISGGADAGGDSKRHHTMYGQQASR